MNGNRVTQEWVFWSVSVALVVALGGMVTAARTMRCPTDGQGPVV